MLKVVARVLALTGAVVAALLTLLWLTQRRMMYFPSGDVPSPAQVGLSRAEAVSLRPTTG